MSIRKYPLPLTSPTQAEALLGVGTGFVGEFQKVLSDSPSEVIAPAVYRDSLRHRLEQLAFEIGGFPALVSDNESDDPPDNDTSKKQKTVKYSPPVGTPGWGCLITMYLASSDFPNGVSMSHVRDKMREFHEKYPKCARFDDKVVKKLCDRGLIVLKGGGPFDGPQRLCLTDLGREMSTSLWQKSLRTENLSSLLQLEIEEPIESFDLILVVDTREFGVMSVLEVSNPGIRIEQRSLPVGDFAWVWRSSKSDEYMAGFIIERKSIEDLSTSIKDGRYEEQRRRLERAPGIEQVIYIIEGSYKDCVDRSFALLPEASIETAIRHTELTDNFGVVRASNTANTAELLLEIHARIQSLGFNKHEESTTFRDFAQDVHKSNTLTIAQVTSKILRSIPGIGDEAVMALNDYFVKTGKGGLSLGNVIEALADPNLNATIKNVTGAKRVAFSGPALYNLRKQYCNES